MLKQRYPHSPTSLYHPSPSKDPGYGQKRASRKRGDPFEEGYRFTRGFNFIASFTGGSTSCQHSSGAIRTQRKSTNDDPRNSRVEKPWFRFSFFLKKEVFHSWGKGEGENFDHPVSPLFLPSALSAGIHKKSYVLRADF